MLEELVATDGNHGDECHELLEVTLGVAVGVQALHQVVKSGLVFHMLQGEEESSAQDTAQHQKVKTKLTITRSESVSSEAEHQIKSHVLSELCLY